MSKLISLQDFEAKDLREITFTARYTMIISGVYEEAQFTIQVPRDHDGYAIDNLKGKVVKNWIKSRIEVEIS